MATKENPNQAKKAAESNIKKIENLVFLMKDKIEAIAKETLSDFAIGLLYRISTAHIEQGRNIIFENQWADTPDFTTYCLYTMWNDLDSIFEKSVQELSDAESKHIIVF